MFLEMERTPLHSLQSSFLSKMMAMPFKTWPEVTRDEFHVQQCSHYFNESPISVRFEGRKCFHKCVCKKQQSSGLLNRLTLAYITFLDELVPKF